MATLEWPLKNFTITAEWGAGRAHNGIDLAAPSGTPIYATDNGTVEASGDGAANNWMGQEAGLYVLVRHSWGFSGYAHMSRYVAQSGQSVRRGQLIGYVGSTGNSTGPHCHFETLPLSPNWGNGFGGRVNPRIGNTIVPHGSVDPNPPTTNSVKGNKMFMIYQGSNYALVGPGFFFEFSGPNAAGNILAQITGNTNAHALSVSDSFWAACKKAAGK